MRYPRRVDWLIDYPRGTNARTSGSGPPCRETPATYGSVNCGGKESPGYAGGFSRSLHSPSAPADGTPTRLDGCVSGQSYLTCHSVGATKEIDRCEAEQGPAKARVRPMRGLNTDRTASVVIRGNAFIQDLRLGYCELGVETAPVYRLATAYDALHLAIRMIPPPRTSGGTPARACRGGAQREAGRSDRRPGGPGADEGDDRRAPRDLSGALPNPRGAARGHGAANRSQTRCLPASAVAETDASMVLRFKTRNGCQQGRKLAPRLAPSPVVWDVLSGSGSDENCWY